MTIHTARLEYKGYAMSKTTKEQLEKLAQFKLSDGYSLIDSERKHLEGLLKDRFNFYILLELFIIFGSDQIKGDQDAKFFVLIVGTVVSLLLALGIMRTHSLVQSALHEIRLIDDHPYKRYFDRSRLPDANRILIWIPLALTVFVGWLAYLDRPY